MAEPVKRRAYDNSSRREQSRRTKDGILEAARRVFVSKGYRAATVNEIAREAGVHVDTVYELVGRKAVMLRELIERAISGTDQAVTAKERTYVQAMRAEPDAARKLVIYAGAVRAIQYRMAPLFLALREAAGGEPEADEVWREISARRARNMRDLVEDVQSAAGGLRTGVAIADAADMVWATNSSELYTMLTKERGWSGVRYERWLADTWCRLLLPD